MNTEIRLDRRVQRTRAALRAALLSLIAEKGYDTLTIEEITARANFRRATWYLHYRDKDELLLDALNETFNALAHEAESHLQNDGLAGKTTLAAYLVTFRHAEQNHKLYKTLLTGRTGALVARRVRDYLAGLVLRALPTTQAVGIPSVVLAHYIAGAELALVTWWLENDRPYSVEQMAEMAQQLIINGIHGGKT